MMRSMPIMSMLPGVEVPGGGANGVLLRARPAWMALGKLHRIAMALDVHVERRGFGAQQVVVQRADLDAAFLELAS